MYYSFSEHKFNTFLFNLFLFIPFVKIPIIPFVKFISKCFIHFDTMLMELNSSFILSYSSKQVQKNVIDFCILAVYPSTLLNAYISSNNI